MSQKNSPPKLTPRQQQVLDIIKATIASHGYPPTRVEIAQQLGFKSPNAAEDHLRALAKKGAIKLVSGTSRGIRLTDSAGNPQAHKAGAALTQKSAATKPKKNNAVRPASYSDAANNDLLNLAVIGRVAAGSPVLATEHIEKELAVGAQLFQSAPDYLLRVRGLSMRDAGILEGDLLAVKKTAEARNGQIVVARIGDEVTVKRLEATPQGVILHAENPDFDPIHVGADDSFELEGIAVGLIRDWN